MLFSSKEFPPYCLKFNAARNNNRLKKFKTSEDATRDFPKVVFSMPYLCISLKTTFIECEIKIETMRMIPGLPGLIHSPVKIAVAKGRIDEINDSINTFFFSFFSEMKLDFNPA